MQTTLAGRPAPEPSWVTCPRRSSPSRSTRRPRRWSSSVRRRRRWQPMGFPAGLSDDRRLVPVAAALAGVAAFASLISEWQVTAVDRVIFGGVVEGEGGGGDKVTIPTEIADVGVLGTGYLLG